MAHELFISYASEDKQTADAVCTALEAKGVRCWYAPRDVPYGIPFEEAVVDAICASRVVVLVLSSHSNTSARVKREIRNACGDEKQIPVLLFRVEEFALDKALQYYLGSIRVLDASQPPLETHLQRLVEHVQAHLPHLSSAALAAKEGKSSRTGSRSDADVRGEPASPSSPRAQVRRMPSELKGADESGTAASEEKSEEASLAPARTATDTMNDAEAEKDQQGENFIKSGAGRLRWHTTGGVLLGVSLLILFASYIKLFNVIGIDDRLAEQLTARTETILEKKFDGQQIGLILVDESAAGNVPSGKADSSHRQYHAQLIKALGGAGAKVLVFDIAFEKSTEWDEEFGAAIEQAEQMGTRVVVGAELDPGRLEPVMPDPLAHRLENRWGIIEGGESERTGTVRSVALAQKKTDEETGEQPVIPSLALQAIMQFEARAQVPTPFFNPENNQIRLRGPDGQLVRAIPVDDEMHFIVDVVERGEQGKENLYHDVYAQLNNANYLTRFRGKIVLIGYKVGDEQAISANEKRHGVEIQANAVSNILLGVHIRPLSTSFDYLIIVAMILIGAVMQIRFSQWMTYKLPLKVPGIFATDAEIPVLLFVVTLAYLLLAALAYKEERILCEGMAYHIAALFSAYWITKAAQGKPNYN